MRDIDLLAALINNDAAKFNQIIDRLRKEARDMAMAILDSQDVEDATLQAVDKALDWLRGSGPFHVYHPAAYVKRLVHNEVVDYGKAHKGQALSEEDVKDIITWVEGDSWDEEERDRRSEEGLGWRAVKVKQTRQISVAKARELQLARAGIEVQHPHPWLRKVDGLVGRQGWITYTWLAHQYLENKFRGTGIKVRDKQVNLLLKSEQDKRWQQYKFVMALIDAIPGLREQEIMNYFLWGYRVMDIATRLDVTKAYISKVVGKWLGTWGWDELQIQKARFILLTHNLAKAYSFWYRKAKKEARRQYLIRYGEYDSKSSFDKDGLEGILARMMATGPDETPYMCEEFYNKVIVSVETRSYFSDLKKEDAVDLFGTCQLCYEWWYLNLAERYREYMSVG